MDGHYVEKKMRPLRYHGPVSSKFFVQKFIHRAILSSPRTKDWKNMLNLTLEIESCLLSA